MQCLTEINLALSAESEESLTAGRAVRRPERRAALLHGAGVEEKMPRSHGRAWGLPGVSDGTRLGRGEKPESKMIYRKGGH